MNIESYIGTKLKQRSRGKSVSFYGGVTRDNSLEIKQEKVEGLPSIIRRISRDVEQVSFFRKSNEMSAIFEQVDINELRRKAHSRLKCSKDSLSKQTRKAEKRNQIKTFGRLFMKVDHPFSTLFKGKNKANLIKQDAGMIHLIDRTKTHMKRNLKGDYDKFTIFY